MASQDEIKTLLAAADRLFDALAPFRYDHDDIAQRQAAHIARINAEPRYPLEPGELDFDEIVRLVQVQGVPAYVEQTGGGCATIYAGDMQKQRIVIAGPGRFAAYGWSQARGSIEEFSIGFDAIDSPYDELSFGQYKTEQEAADAIALASQQDCGGAGWIYAQNGRIERCEVCCRFEDDEHAVEHVGELWLEKYGMPRPVGEGWDSDEQHDRLCALESEDKSREVDLARS
jgi:hypothetical protein